LDLHASLSHAHRDFHINHAFGPPPTRDDYQGLQRLAEACLTRSHHIAERGWRRHQRDHAADRQVEDLRLALAGTVHGGRHRRPPLRQDAALAHPSARPRGGRARGGADAYRSAGRDHPLDGRSDGADERHQCQRGPAHLEAHGLQPHRYRQFKLSNDPNFIDKLRDVVGLYVDPPARAIVLSLDEKSQIQALDRTQPGLPLKKGRLGTMTHDYKRHGTTTLFAALNVLDGTVIGRNMQRHRHQEFIRFLNAIEAEVPAGKMVHVILDNYAAHKHPKVRAWLDRHQRFVFHFTPTSASWLNAVEGFFAKLARRRLKRGVFRSVIDLQAAINRFLTGTNAEPKPFTWTADPDKIISAVKAPSVRFHPLARSVSLSSAISVVAAELATISIVRFNSNRTKSIPLMLMASNCLWSNVIWLSPYCVYASEESAVPLA